MYALVDCNNFFVSCERVFRPDLRDKPVVVLSGNDGCVVARSNEVKKLGIKMGVPFYQIQNEVEKYGIVHFSSNFALYGDISSRIMHWLSHYTDDLQQYSIDEAFMDLSYLQNTHDAKALCERIRAEILQGIGVPVSIGIAPTKTLCKVASHYAKKYSGYRGVCVIDTEERRLKALSLFSIDEVWGIGRQSVAKLRAAGIKTALDFANKRALFAQNMLHQPGLNTWRELNGEDCISVRELPEKQSITCSRTFAHGVTDRDLLEQALCQFCANVAQKLRRQHSVCRQMVVFAHTSRFQEQQFVIQSTVTFQTSTANTQEMTDALLRVVRSQWRPNTPYKRAGVIVLSVLPDTGVQQSLFDTRDRQRDQRLQQTIDQINSRHGKSTIGFTPNIPTEEAKELYEVGAKSPAYTTRIDDIITLKC